MWISELTPVTTSSITAESWSSCRATVTWRSPTGIHSQYGKTSGPSAPPRTSARTIAMESASRASSTPTRMTDTASFARGRISARTPFATNPASGSAGTSHRSCRAPGISALEEIDVLQVDRPLVAVDREDDRQADRRLSGRHRHHEEHEDLPCHAQRPRQRHERPGRGGKHQPHAHED